ncbi:MAG: alpha/beta fold hydrolase [Gemmiger sp.]|nr:alpha/beta fold hydrolase [Gemmiger sp.]
MAKTQLVCEEIHYPSADGRHTVAARLYTMPGVALCGVLQLSHGMCEYVARYRHMAEFFAANGYALAGNDHLGHGDSATPAEYGHFADANGRTAVLEDLKAMNEQLHSRYPALPVVLYGHSMGSFFARWYAERYPQSIDGLVLSGTGGPSALNNVGLALSGAIAKLRGPRYISPLMVKLNFGSYCNRIESPASPNAWLSRDEAVVKAYDADPKCTFRFSVGTYHEMLWVLVHVSGKKWAAALPKALPVLLIAGDGDPVGNYGQGVRDVYALLGDAGMEDLTCQIYEGGRHELHNELNKAEVFDFTLAWLKDRWPGEALE